MVRQAYHERNQQLTICPELVEGLIQSFLNGIDGKTPSRFGYFQFSAGRSMLPRHVSRVGITNTVPRLLPPHES
jgi:hypothetical protein